MYVILKRLIRQKHEGSFMGLLTDTLMRLRAALLDGIHLCKMFQRENVGQKGMYGKGEKRKEKQRDEHQG